MRIHPAPGRCFCVLLALFAAGGGGLRAQEAPAAVGFAPETYDISRYEHIWKQSPFYLETTVMKVSDGLEKRFALTGIAKVGGKPMAFLLDRSSQLTIAVSPEANKEGLELLSILQNPDPRHSNATIRLGNEQAVIQFDPATLATTGAGGAVNVPQEQQEASVANGNPANGSPPRPVRVIRRAPIRLPK